MLRPVTAADREAYLAMAHDFYRSDAVDHTVPDDHLRKTFDTLMEKTPYASCRILEKDGCTAGYVLLAHTWSQEAGGETVWIEELYILPRFRGKGLGTSVFAALEKEYPTAARFRLEVCPDNIGARELYSRMGYHILDYWQMIRDNSCK